MLFGLNNGLKEIFFKNNLTKFGFLVIIIDEITMLEVTT